MSVLLHLNQFKPTTFGEIIKPTTYHTVVITKVGQVYVLFYLFLPYKIKFKTNFNFFKWLSKHVQKFIDWLSPGTHLELCNMHKGSLESGTRTDEIRNRPITISPNHLLPDERVSRQQDQINWNSDRVQVLTAGRTLQG